KIIQMVFSFQLDNCNYRFDADEMFDISIPLNFNGAQPNAYGVQRATAKACEAESLIGDTRRGGSCNFEEYKLIPHCNGTHTECVGHLTHQRLSIHDSLKDAFIPATLITVQPENASKSGEKYSVKFGVNDKIITKKTLSEALKNKDEIFLRGLIIRILPNNQDKMTRKYEESNSSYFSTEAMNFIREKNVKHLLVDLPSIDRTDDQGKLANHRIFWNVEEGSYNLKEGSLINSTITEMIFVPDNVIDGNYMLNLQISPFKTDTSPSRPVLFKLYNQ
ncbi:MAG: cyclase family protein, partial [Pyrinomonadaceae bacterium]